MEHVREELKGRRKNREELSEMERKLQATKEKAKSDIKKRAQDVISDVEAKKHQMMALVEMNYQKNLTILRKKQNHTKDITNQLENVYSTVQNVIDTAADHNLLQHASLVDQMDSLCFTHRSEVSSLDFDTFVFTSGSAFQEMSWFGHVDSYRQTPEVKAKTRQSKAPSLKG